MIRTAILILLAGPAIAQDSFSLPSGCTGYVTVQKRGCIVSHLFTCQSDPTGHQRRVDMNDTGLIYLGTIDAETQWIESTHVVANSTERLLPNAADSASFTQLRATGRDDWDFETEDNLGLRSRNVGTDEIISQFASIDGIGLQITAFTITVTDPATGQFLWSGVGQEYIHPEWRTFLSGARTITTPTETYDTDNTPVEFSFPGETGFLAVNPRYDCDVVISGPVPDATLAAIKRN